MIGNEITIECDRKQHRRVSNNFLFVLIFFSILSPAKRPFQADGSKWLKRLLLVANRDRPCTFVHFLTPPPPISLPSLSPMTSVLFKHLESLRKSSCAVHRIRNYPQNYWSFLFPVPGLADLVHGAKMVKLKPSRIFCSWQDCYKSHVILLDSGGTQSGCAQIRSRLLCSILV